MGTKNMNIPGSGGPQTQRAQRKCGRHRFSWMDFLIQIPKRSPPLKKSRVSRITAGFFFPSKFVYFICTSH